MRLRSRRWLALALGVGGALAFVVAALAFWTSPGGGITSAVVSGMTSPAPSATSATYGMAHIAWSSVTLDPPVPSVDGEVTFTVERKVSSGSTWAYVCSTGTTPKLFNELSCDDTPPVSGSYDYRVTASFRTWTSAGVASITFADATAPTSVISSPSATVYSAATWNTGCVSTICGTASDTGGSDLHKVEVNIQRGSGNYWNGSAFASAGQVWNLATGTTSWVYGFPAANFPADGSYTVSSRGTDNALNVQSPVAAQTFTIDTTAPSIGASTIAATTGTSPTGFVRQGGGYVVYADVSDVNGVSSATADVSALTTGQTSVSLASCVSGCTVGGHTYPYKSAALTASSPLAEGAKSYTVAASDVVGNSSSSSGFSAVVDNTGPSVSTVIAATTGTSPQGFVRQAGTYRVYANVTDAPAGTGAASGVDASSITADVSTVTAGFTAVGFSPCGGCGPGSAYGYQTVVLTASTPLSEGSKAYSVSASDNLGTGGASSGASVQVDNTAPTVATVLANATTNEAGWLTQGGTYRVYANVADLPSGSGAASGVDASALTANVGNLTAGQTAVAISSSGCPCTIGGTTYAYRTSALTADNPLSGSKTFTTSASDNLGFATSLSDSATVDNTAPTLSTLQMFDTDDDGKVDQVKATFGETLTAYSAGTAPWSLANAPGGAPNTLASVSVATTVATLTLNEGTVNTASGSFSVALAANVDGVRDLAGNQASFSSTAVADKAAPVAVDVQAANGTGTAGRIDSGDVVTYTFSEAMSASSIKSGWSGAALAVTVALGSNGTNDTVSVSTAGVNLGTIGTGANYVKSDRTGNATIALSGAMLTLTFTSTAPNGQLNTVASSTMVWTPSTSAADPAGNAMSGTSVTQSGAPKRNF
jgi:chitinase